MLLTLVDGPELTQDVLAFAHSTGLPIEAAVFDTAAGGAGADIPVDLEAVADALAKQGVATVHVIRHESLADAVPQAFGRALAQLVGTLEPEGVVAAGDDRATEIMAHAAARTRLPLATNCVALTPSGDGSSGDAAAWRLTRTRAGGVLLEDAELSAPVKLVTVAAGASAGSAEDPETAEVSAPAECVVREFVPELPGDDVVGRVVARERVTGGVTLATAPVIVSGGRGVGSAEGYAVLEELAGLLGGAVGCSRVATNNGWRPHSDQVGLTGTKVSCDLYLACGISGATQHWVGCMDSKTILAVNTDSEAPLMARAHYAVVGDVHEVLPAVIAELKARRG